MTLSELKALAEKARIEDQASDGSLGGAIVEYIAAASPEVVLALVEVAIAADVFSRSTPIYVVPVKKHMVDIADALAALHALTSKEP